MSGTIVPADLSGVKLKRDAFRDNLLQFHEKASSLLYISLQWKDLDEHYSALDEALGRKKEELLFKEETLREILRDVEAKLVESRYMEEMIEDRCKDLDIQADELGEKYRLAVEEKGRVIDRAFERRLEEIEEKEKSFESQSLSVQTLIDQRFKEVERREKQLGRVQKEVRRQREQIAEKSRELEAESVKTKEQLAEFELREKMHEARIREFEIENVKFESAKEDLSERLKEVDERLRGLESKSKELEGRSRVMELEKERFELDKRRLNEQLKAVELKEKRVEERAEEVESKLKGLELKLEMHELNKNIFGVDRAKLDELLEELESDRKKFDSDRKILDERLREVELKDKEANERAMELQLEEKQLKERWEEFVSNVSKFDVDRSKLDEQLRELESNKREANSDRSKLDQQLREIEWKDKHANEREKELELENKISEERGEDLGLSRRNLEVGCGKLDMPMRELESNEREFDSDRTKLDEKLRELDLKAKQIEGQRKMLETSKKGFDDEVEKFKLMERKLEEHSKELELRLKQFEDKLLGIQDLKLGGCVTVDGKNLQVLLKECRKDHDKIGDEVLLLLRISQDPAKVVLDAMEGFFPPHLKREDEEFNCSNVRASCILLLEQLKKISPDINQDTRLAARKLSLDWRSKLRPDWEHAHHILGFLLLVANFKLRNDFEDNDLINYSKVIARWRQVPELLQMLGFGDEIPGFIRDLLGRKEYLAAIRFAATFDLLNEFPPEPIMKEYMDVSRSAFKVIFDNENSSLEAQTHAVEKRVRDLKAAIKCIEDHKLKLGYSPSNIWKVIQALNNRLLERRKAAAGNGVEMQGTNYENEKLHISPRISPRAPSSMSISANHQVAQEAVAVAAPNMPTQEKQNTEHSQAAIFQHAVPSAPADPDNRFQSMAPKPELQVTHQDNLPRQNVIQDVISTSSRNDSAQVQKSSFDAVDERLELLLKGGMEDKLQHRIANLLEASPDPAYLVFNTIQGLYSSSFEKDGLQRSILMLKELTKVPYTVKPQLNAKALSFSMSYKSSLEKAKEDHTGVIFFMKFLDAYKVPHCAEQVTDLLDPSIWRREVPHSCQLLGLQDFIPSKYFLLNDLLELSLLGGCLIS